VNFPTILFLVVMEVVFSNLALVQHMTLLFLSRLII